MTDTQEAVWQGALPVYVASLFSQLLVVWRVDKGCCLGGCMQDPRTLEPKFNQPEQLQLAPGGHVTHSSIPQACVHSSRLACIWGVVLWGSFSLQPAALMLLMILP